MKKPNFFIVGASKCGTTAVYEYLKTHPQVFLSDSKEPHYFADDYGDPFRGCTDQETYLTRYFAEAHEGHKVVGEASAAYLYSKNAIPNIKKFNPDARLIVMVRNPADMAYSLHSQLVYDFREDEKDFAKAWALQSQRKAGHRIPDMCFVPGFLQYKDFVCLGAQLQRAYSHFPREQVKVFFFDDLKSNPAAIYAEILRFLDLDPDDRTYFPVVNENKRYRVEWLSKSVRRFPSPVVHMVRRIKKVFGLENVGLIEFTNRMNRVKVSRPPLAEDLRQEILAALSSDIDLLGRLTERDLSSWKNKVDPRNAQKENSRRELTPVS